MQANTSLKHTGTAEKAETAVGQNTRSERVKTLFSNLQRVGFRR